MASEQQKQKNNKRATRFILIFSISMLMTSCIFTRICRFVRVSGSSMYPTYKDEELLLAKAVWNEDNLKIGTVVVFKDPERQQEKTILAPIYLIKRIEGMPGDVLEVKNGILYRNGKKTTDSDIKIKDAGMLKEPYTVPGNAYFCMGDNRNESRDSRAFGAVNVKNIGYIVGKDKKR